jgi:uncharacterized protein
MGLREPAWRVTSRELELSSVEERGSGTRVASYLLSPFGARMNRVVLAGTLGAAEAIGREEPSSFWRASLADPLGRVAVTAGSFQPRAMVQLRASSEDRPALVVGKVHRFVGRDGSGSVSVRAEAVRAVTENDERAALAETLRQTLDRLDLIERIEHEPSVADSALRLGGYPAGWIAAAREAFRQYPEADRHGFREALRGAVAHVAGVRPSPPAPPPGSVRRTVLAPRPPPPEATAAEREAEAQFLGLVDAAAESSEDGYADVREVLQRLADRGVGAAEAEAVLGRLEEGGRLEEPIVGKLRRA